MSYLAHLKTDIIAAAVRWRRYLLFAVVSVLTLILAGSINIHPVKWGVTLFGLEETDVKFVEDALSRFSFLNIQRDKSVLPDAGVLNRNGALWGISKEGETFIITPNLGQHEASAQPFVYLFLLALSERGPKDQIMMQAMLNDNLLQQYIGPKARLGPRTTALPPASEWLFLPRVIAFVVAFLPFFLAIDLLNKDAQNRLLMVHLAAKQGAFVSYVWSKLTFCVVFALCVLLLLLLVTQQVYGLSPKPGLAVLILTQIAAATTSAAYGLITAMVVGNSRQTYGAIATYFLVLIVFGGFLFPIEASAEYVQFLSYAVPLRFSLPILEKWLFFGQLSESDPNAWGALLFLAVLAATLATVISINRRRAF